MALDIAVLQAKYGANLSLQDRRRHLRAADLERVGTFYSCLWDAGGIDAIVHDGSAPAVIDLRPATLQVEPGGGGFLSHVDAVFGGFTIANGVVIENARGGSGGDTISGNASATLLEGRGGDDVIDGLGGADTIDGGAGADTMRGGPGDDTYVVDNAGDIVDEGTVASGGIDLVRTSVSFSLADSVHAIGSIENLTLTGAGAIDGTGNALANLLVGNGAGNVLDGGGGGDTMRGGAGDDTYVVDDQGDVVDEGSRRRRARPGQVLGQLQPRRRRACHGRHREPDPDGSRRHRRHRQCPRQHPRRQHRRQHAPRRPRRGRA